MIERIVENWLTKAGERTYQLPFCYMLTANGYAVVHLTRHCAMELGKDVIALAPDGVPHAYQLKGGDINLTTWRNVVFPQMADLVMGRIVHPAIDSAMPHRPFLVTNGTIHEEVSRAIDDLNAGWVSKGYLPLGVITRGEMLRWALDLGTSLWPSELRDLKTLIELHLSDGHETFPKAKLAALLEGVLPLELVEGRAPKVPECVRALASAALLTSLALTPFVNADNHVAEAEAWTVYAAYAMALAERWDLPESAYSRELALAKQAACNALGRLVEELRGRERLTEGDEMLDTPFLPFRLTWIVGLVAAWALHRRLRGESTHEGVDEGAFPFDADSFAWDFCLQHRGERQLWGEAAVPLFLAYYLWWRSKDAGRGPALHLRTLLDRIVTAHTPEGRGELPGPYYEAADLLPHALDAELQDLLPDGLRIAEAPLKESFRGHSYMLEGVLHLIVRQLYRQHVRTLWPAITQVTFATFEYVHPWHRYRWRNPREGRERTVMPNLTQSWSELADVAMDREGRGLPRLIREDPAFAVLFGCVFPHRVDADFIRYVDGAVRERALSAL